MTDAVGPNRVSKSGPEFVVIGAGLAGLAAAGTLHRAGREVLVRERNDAVGGRVRTDREGGFLLDRGFQVLLTAYPELDRHLDLSALNLRPFLRGANVWDGNSFVELADPRSSFRGALNGLRTSVLTHADRIRLLRLALRLRRSRVGLFDNAADRPMQQFLAEMKFSASSIDAIWEPLFSGIQLTSSLEGSARLGSLILRCLILGPAAVPAAGMQAIPEQLASNLPPACTSVKITSTAGRPSIAGFSCFIGSMGMPRPSALTEQEPSTPMLTTMELAYPAMTSSMALSTAS